MKTQVKKIDQHKRELIVQIEGDIVRQRFDAVYKEIGKEAKIPGFRPGKVPLDILEKHYSAAAHQEVLKQLLPEIYNQALIQEGLQPASLPKISEVNLGKESLSFKANLEVKPGIDLKNYKGLKIKYKPVEVTREEVNSSLDKIKETFKQISDDTWVRSLGYPNFEQLKVSLERQIYLEKVRTQRINIENSIIEQLLKQVDFPIPQSLVLAQLEELVRQAKVDLALRGVSKEEIEKQEPILKENLRAQAEHQVRVFLVLEEVARRENIVCDEQMTQKVMEFLLREADWQETS